VPDPSNFVSKRLSAHDAVPHLGSVAYPLRHGNTVVLHVDQVVLLQERDLHVVTQVRTNDRRVRVQDTLGDDVRIIEIFDVAVRVVPAGDGGDELVLEYHVRHFQQQAKLLVLVGYNVGERRRSHHLRVVGADVVHATKRHYGIPGDHHVRARYARKALAHPGQRDRLRMSGHRHQIVRALQTFQFPDD